MKKILIIIFIGLTGQLTLAQQVPFYSQYFFNPFIYNSSYTGKTGETKAFLTHRNQWTGIQGAPVTTMFTIEGPIDGEKWGLGASMYSDRTDILNRSGARLSGSYMVKIQEEHELRFGLGLGVLNNTIDYSSAIVEDVTDPNLFSADQNRTVLDADFGISYFWKGLNVGFSIPQLLDNDVNYNKVDNDESVVYDVKRHYITSVGYDYDIDEKWSVHGVGLGRFTAGAPTQFDIGALASYEKLGWVGFMYRYQYAIAFIAGGKINEKLYLGLTYDIITNDLARYAGSSSEILVGYVFGKSAKDKEEEARQKAEMKQQMDSLENALKATVEQTEKNTEAIDSLGNEIQNVRNEVDEAIEEMKSAPPSNGGGGGAVVVPIPAKSEKDDLSDDYLDNQGEALPLGFYIVVGSYSEQKWARQAKLRFINAGFPETDVLYNITNKFYNVFLSFTKDEAEARQNLKNARAEYPDAWLRVIR